MITISFNSKKESKVMDKTAETITNFVMNNLNKDVTIIKEENNIEVVSGNYSNKVQDISIDVCFKFKKCISYSDAEDKDKLDKLIFELKKCLEGLSSIEKDTYIPIIHRGAND